ncbi:MAG: Curli production assembly/transport component CsgG [Bacteroidetes bacterium OLB9]|nr:MAG: Curli production assembly/transport component CsgG [Bacteroidetes bacterium OLB9]
MRSFKILFLCLVSSLISYSQEELKPIVGVAEFSSEVDSKYCGAVAEKVVQVVTNTKRFTVVDRTSYDKVKQELEFQKSEVFLDSKNTVKQDMALAAHHMIVGHIVKMSIYAMKNVDGSINGYKASTSFTLKVNDVETGKTTEAQSFQTKVSPLMLSPESAINEALNSIETDLYDYFIKTFPLTTKISKINAIKKESASAVIIAGGKAFGFKEGDKLIVERIEMLDGKPFPTQIGEIKIDRLVGDDFAECNVLKGGKEILTRFNAAEKLTCKLIVK